MPLGYKYTTEGTKDGKTADTARKERRCEYDNSGNVDIKRSCAAYKVKL